MTKTDIIGHRGAAGLAPENTMESFGRAAEVGVRTIEFDVRASRDGQFVVCHDADLKRISDYDAVIAATIYEELKKLSLHNGESVPLLTEVLDFARAKQLTVIVEIKVATHLEVLCRLLDRYPDLTMTIASFRHDAIAEMKKLRPHYRYYLAEKRHPFGALRKAKSLGMQGIDLNFKLMNPVTYWLALLWRLEIMVYTVDSKFIGHAIRLFYPGVAICTNHPEKFIGKF